VRKIIDANGRIFGLISFIDIVVFIVALVLVSAFFVRANVIYTPATADASANVTYTVRIQSVRATNAALLRPGDSLYSRDHGSANMGTIVAVDITESYAAEQLLDGTIVIARVHERYDVVLTVEAEGSVSGGRFFANRIVELNANAGYRLFTRYNQFEGTLMMIYGGL